jgi:signal peptidase I
VNDVADDLALTGEPMADEPRGRGTRGFDWWGEAKGLFWLLLAVLGFHSFIAKPFYIPSESMLPGLEVGDRLIVSKYAYGWSFVSPTVPDPVAIFRGTVLRQPVDSWSWQPPAWRGRIWGKMPARGDVVIVTPPGQSSDYIKRVIGLPGDTLQVRGGTVILNGRPVSRGPVHYRDLPIDANATCDMWQYPDARTRLPGGGEVCRLPIVTETLPNGRRFDTVELGESPGDEYGPIRIPAGRVFLMGDNRDRSADSRFALGGSEKGLGGPVPWENIGGRAEFITFSVDGSATLNPLTWWPALRPGRAGTSLHPEETR